MRAVVQRVKKAGVVIDGETVGAIREGSLILLGVEEGDNLKDLDYIFEKSIGLRIFEDENGKMNLSLKEVNGSVLLVSQFTLLGDCRKGRRPSFSNALKPEDSMPLYERFIEMVKAEGIHIETGVFGADMQVELINDGPVTLLLDSRRKF